MKKIEIIWHHLLYSALTDAVFQHTQQEIAKRFHYSLSTVNHALKIPTQIGAIRKESKYFIMEYLVKLLYYWASARNLAGDIIYQSYYPGSINEIEGLVPPHSIYAGYSAARKMLGEAPADYNTVYCYIKSSDLKLFKDRYRSDEPKRKQPSNIIALKAAPEMFQYGEITSLPQTFVDIWNLKDWFSRDFTQRLEKKINELLS